MMAIKILLEERMPQDMIITKEEKEKIEKIKYKDYEDYAQRKYTKINAITKIINDILTIKIIFCFLVRFLKENFFLFF